MAKKTNTAPIDLILELLKNNPGVALGDRHGQTAIIDFLSDHMEQFAKSGVKHLYFEMIPSRHQAATEHFNTTGNVTKEFPITPSHAEPTYSRHEVACVDYALNPWNNKNEGVKERYIALLNKARDNGIRIIGIDGHEGAGNRRMHDSNPHWAAVINQHNKELKPGEKYLVFGGHYHFAHFDLPNAPSPPPPSVNELLAPPVPAVRMAMSRTSQAHVLEQPRPEESDYVVLLPKNPKQPRPTQRDHEESAYQQLVASDRNRPKPKDGVGVIQI